MSKQDDSRREEIEAAGHAYARGASEQVRQYLRAVADAYSRETGKAVYSVQEVVRWATANGLLPPAGDEPVTVDALGEAVKRLAERFGTEKN